MPATQKPQTLHASFFANPPIRWTCHHADRRYGIGHLHRRCVGHILQALSVDRGTALNRRSPASAFRVLYYLSHSYPEWGHRCCMQAIWRITRQLITGTLLCAVLMTNRRRWLIATVRQFSKKSLLGPAQWRNVPGPSVESYTYSRIIGARMSGSNTYSLARVRTRRSTGHDHL